MNRRARLEEMLKSDPTDAFLLFGLAMEAVRENDHPAAVQGFQNLLATHPQHAAGYLQLGQVWMRAGEESQAAEVFRNGIAVARQSGDSHAAAEMQGFLDTL